MTLFPFVLVQKRQLIRHPSFMRHEKIHLQQQLELGILPFYLLYLLCYTINRLRRMPHNTAYRQIIFEQEAYDFDTTPGYLHFRKPYAWWKYRESIFG
jgi:hypothetical protein